MKWIMIPVLFFTLLFGLKICSMDTNKTLEMVIGGATKNAEHLK